MAYMLSYYLNLPPPLPRKATAYMLSHYLNLPPSALQRCICVCV